MTELLSNLLSGLVGALIGAVSTIGFTIWRDKQEGKRKIAKEKLQRVYGPILALIKKQDLWNNAKGSFPLSSNPQELEMIDKIIFDYYYLLDEDLRDDFVLLHSNLKNNSESQMKFPGLVDKIRKHYKENKRILGIKR